MHRSGSSASIAAFAGCRNFNVAIMCICRHEVHCPGSAHARLRLPDYALGLGRAEGKQDYPDNTRVHCTGVPEILELISKQAGVDW